MLGLTGFITDWYKNNVPNNPYNDISLDNSSLSYTLTPENPINYENDLIFSNKLITGVIPNTTNDIGCFVINDEYLINIPSVDVNTLTSLYENITTTIVTEIDIENGTTQNLNGLSDLIEYFYNNNKLLNIVLPLQPVFMLNFYNYFLKNFYVNGNPMFTLNWVSTTSTDELISLNSNLNSTSTNPSAMFPFMTSGELSSIGTNNVLGSYNMPYRFFQGNNWTKFYFQLIDTIPFTYVLHVYTFSIKSTDPILHAIYVTRGENDSGVESVLNNYFDQTSIYSPSTKTILFYSGQNTYYNTNLTISINPNMLDQFVSTFPVYDPSRYYIYYGRDMYTNYVQILYRVGQATDFIFQ